MSIVNYFQVINSLCMVVINGNIKEKVKKEKYNCLIKIKYDCLKVFSITFKPLLHVAYVPKCLIFITYWVTDKKVHLLLTLIFWYPNIAKLSSSWPVPVKSNLN